MIIILIVIIIIIIIIITVIIIWIIVILLYFYFSLAWSARVAIRRGYIFYLNKTFLLITLYYLYI